MICTASREASSPQPVVRLVHIQCPRPLPGVQGPGYSLIQGHRSSYAVELLDDTDARPHGIEFKKHFIVLSSCGICLHQGQVFRDHATDWSDAESALAIRATTRICRQPRSRPQRWPSASCDPYLCTNLCGESVCENTQTGAIMFCTRAKPASVINRVSDRRTCTVADIERSCASGPSAAAGGAG